MHLQMLEYSSNEGRDEKQRREIEIEGRRDSSTLYKDDHFFLDLLRYVLYASGLISTPPGPLVSE